MGELGLDPETALKLILALLRGSAYFFVGFALLAFGTYVVFLCLEIFSAPSRAKARIAKVPQLVSSAPVAERHHNLISAKTLILDEEATARKEEAIL